jgi:quinol monooxygenase YgiN
VAFYRRKFLKYLTATMVIARPTQASSQAEKDMYGMIAKLTTVPGKREDMIGVLRGSAANMPGCLSYVVAKDSADENVLWVTEVWDNKASHDGSLLLSTVRKAIPQGQLLVSRFEKIADTSPVWGVGLPPAP